MKEDVLFADLHFWVFELKTPKIIEITELFWLSTTMLKLRSTLKELGELSLPDHNNQPALKRFCVDIDKEISNFFELCPELKEKKGSSMTPSEDECLPSASNSEPSFASLLNLPSTSASAPTSASASTSASSPTSASEPISPSTSTSSSQISSPWTSPSSASSSPSRPSWALFSSIFDNLIQQQEGRQRLNMEALKEYDLSKMAADSEAIVSENFYQGSSICDESVREHVEMIRDFMNKHVYGELHTDDSLMLLFRQFRAFYIHKLTKINSKQLHLEREMKKIRFDFSVTKKKSKKGFLAARYFAKMKRRKRLEKTLKKLHRAIANTFKFCQRHNVNYADFFDDDDVSDFPWHPAEIELCGLIEYDRIFSKKMEKYQQYLSDVEERILQSHSTAC